MLNERVLSRTFSYRGYVNLTLLDIMIEGIDINSIMYIDEIYKNGIIHINSLSHKIFDQVYQNSLEY